MSAHVFHFEGSVSCFGKDFCSKWSARTMASSKEEAERNLVYRFKKEIGVPPHAGGFKLLGKLYVKGEKEWILN